MKSLFRLTAASFEIGGPGGRVGANPAANSAIPDTAGRWCRPERVNQVVRSPPIDLGLSSGGFQSERFDAPSRVTRKMQVL
jgi:hypothetical protein